MNLREAAENAIRALRRATYIGRPEITADCESAIGELHAALAEADEPAQGPVAWRYKPMIGLLWSFSDDGYYVSCKRDKGYIVEALYTHPPRREPLTEDEVRRLYRGAWTPESEANEVLAFARAVERAHGIGTDE